VEQRKKYTFINLTLTSGGVICVSFCFCGYGETEFLVTTASSNLMMMMITAMADACLTQEEND
jgi:hypothetical protein